METLKFLIIIPMFLLTILNGFSQSENDSIIYWDKNVKLQWNDFQCHKTDSLLSIKDMAGTNYQIIYLYKSCYSCKVIITFDKFRSWTKDTISQDLLNHEQGHFDIAEIYGRKIRKYIQDYCDGELEKFNINEVDNILSEDNSFQDKYDTETKHGVNKVAQKKWNELISNELEMLKEYEVNYQDYIEE